MADDEYDFSSVSNTGHFDIENSVLSKWRSENEEEDDDDFSYFWPDHPPYEIEEKLREINKVHEEDETPLESQRKRKVKFNSRVQMRAISMRHIPQPAEEEEDPEEPFDLHKYESDETVDDEEAPIEIPVASAKPAEEPKPKAAPGPQSRVAAPRQTPAAMGSGHSAAHRKTLHKISKVPQVVNRPGGVGGASTSGQAAKRGLANPGRRGFSDEQNLQFDDSAEEMADESAADPERLAEDRLSVLSLTDDDADSMVPAKEVASDTGYSSWSLVEEHCDAPLPVTPSESELVAVRTLQTQTDELDQLLVSQPASAVVPTRLHRPDDSSPGTDATTEPRQNVSDLLAADNAVTRLAMDTQLAFQKSCAQFAEEQNGHAEQTSPCMNNDNAVLTDIISPVKESGHKLDDSNVEHMDDHTNSQESGSDTWRCDLVPSQLESPKVVVIKHSEEQALAAADRTNIRDGRKSPTFNVRKLTLPPASGAKISERPTAVGARSGTSTRKKKQLQPAASPIKVAEKSPPEKSAPKRPYSAPARKIVTTVPATQRRTRSNGAARRSAAAEVGVSEAAPLRRSRRRAAAQDPSLTFQQWLVQHEKERTRAIEERKNGAKKRKQEAAIKKEQSPLAFRVWLRKKRQQQMMDQRVHQLRHQEQLAQLEQQHLATPAPHQCDAFRLWLQRKRRDRADSAPTRPQTTLRCLASLYSPHPGSPAGWAGGAAAGRPHDGLQRIYRPHSANGRRARSAYPSGS